MSAGFAILLAAGVDVRQPAMYFFGDLGRQLEPCETFEEAEGTLVLAVIVPVPGDFK
jgi:hypothetical protein